MMLLGEKRELQGGIWDLHLYSICLPIQGIFFLFLFFFLLILLLLGLVVNKKDLQKVGFSYFFSSLIGFILDPVLLSSYARASVTGLQGGYQSFPNTYLNHDYILSLAKHFAAYGQTSGGLNASPSDISLQRLYEIYLAPWKEYFNSGGRGLMVAHNTINGVPCHGNEWLLQQVLRNEFGWKV